MASGTRGRFKSEHRFKMKVKLLPVVIAAMMVLPADAAPRNTASYSIVAETADGGGGKTISASYSNDGSIGGVGGTGTVTSPVEIAKHGYIGQLYDVTGVVLSASPATVNETGTRQLKASAALDDGTFLALAAGQFSWSIVSGPINSINASGLATAGNVYQDTGATVRGDYQQRFGTFGLTVLNVGIDDFGSYASDGIDDVWSLTHTLFQPASFIGSASRFHNRTVWQHCSCE